MEYPFIARESVEALRVLSTEGRLWSERSFSRNTLSSSSRIRLANIIYKSNGIATRGVKHKTNLTIEDNTGKYNEKLKKESYRHNCKSG